jgi:predicted nucleic acid-binding protein
MKAVVNATPLIALSLVGHLELLNRLFQQVYVPASVYEEVVGQRDARPGSAIIKQSRWLKIRMPHQSSPIPVALMGLDIGEQDVILLGQEIGADWLLIDERLGRNIAQNMGFQVKGTLGILLVGYQLQLLSKQKAVEAVDTLGRSSVRLSANLIEWFKTQIEDKSQ